MNRIRLMLFLLVLAGFVFPGTARASTADWTIDVPRGACSALAGALGAGGAAAVLQVTPVGRVSAFVTTAGAFLGGAVGMNLGELSCDSLGQTLERWSHAACMANQECADASARNQMLQFMKSLGRDMQVCPSCSIDELLGSALTVDEQRLRYLRQKECNRAGYACFTGVGILPKNRYWSGLNTVPMDRFWAGVAIGMGSRDDMGPTTSIR